jgi:hypothetical protein
MKEVIIEIDDPVAATSGYPEHYPVRLLVVDQSTRQPVPSAAPTPTGRIPVSALSPEDVQEMTDDLMNRLSDDVTLRKYGETLFGALVSAVPQWTTYLDDDEPCRTYLNLPPVLRRAPWELLYRDGEWLGLTQPVVRMATPTLAAPLAPEWPIRMLILVGVSLKPQDPAVRPADEIEQITQALRPVERLFDIRVPPAPASFADLEREIDTFLPHIVHFIGHGDLAANGRPCLKFPAWDLTTDRIKTLLNAKTRAAAGKKPWAPRLAFLNACRSAVAEAAQRVGSVADAFLGVGAESVLAMQADIKGTTAGQFAGTLYVGLGKGLPLDLALVEARRAVAGKDNVSVVGEACLATFTATRAPEAIFPPWSALAPDWLGLMEECEYMEVVQYFVNHLEPRRDLVYKLWPYKGEAPHHFCVMHGPEGVGKSSLAVWLLDLCIRVGHFFRYVSLRDTAGKSWLDVLRDIRGPKPDPASPTPAFDALPYDMFGMFHYQLKHLAQGMEPVAPWDGAPVEDPGGMVPITDRVLNAFLGFRAGLEKVAEIAPVVIVLDEFSDIEAGTFWTLWEHLFKPIASRQVKNVRLVAVLTDSEFETRFAIKKTLQQRPQLQATHATRPLSLLPASKFVEITEEFMLVRYENLREDRELLHRALERKARNWTTDWSMVKMQEYAAGLARHLGE